MRSERSEDPTLSTSPAPVASSAGFEAFTQGYGAVLFDCDGTLVDSEPLCERAWAATADEHGIPNAPEAPGASFTQRIDALRVAHPSLPATATLHRAYWARLRELYRAELRAIQPVYGVALALQAANFPIAVVSNSEQSRLEYTIRCATPLLDAPLIGLTSSHRPKPAPDLYLHAAGRLGVSPPQCLVMEDSAIGAEAARAAGMTVALLQPVSRSATLVRA